MEKKKRLNPRLRITPRDYSSGRGKTPIQLDGPLVGAGLSQFIMAPAHVSQAPHGALPPAHSLGTSLGWLYIQTSLLTLDNNVWPLKTFSSLPQSLQIPNISL